MNREQALSYGKTLVIALLFVLHGVERCERTKHDAALDKQLHDAPVVTLDDGKGGHKLGSSTPWGGDLAGSGNAAQYVASISGSANGGGDVPVTSTGLKISASPFNIKDSSAVTRMSLETSHGQLTAGGGGSDYRAIIGPLTGFPASNAGFWLIDNSTSPTGNNVTMYGDGSNIFINGASENGAKPIWMSWGGTTGRFKFNSDGTTATMSYDKAVFAVINQATATAATVGDFSITAQAAGGTNAGAALALSGGAHSGSSVEDGPVKIKSPLNGGWLTFTAVNGAQTLTNAQSDANFFNFAAGASGAVTINYLRAIADTSCFFAKNNTSQTITIAYLTGGTVTMATATSALICSDGANLQKVMTGT